MNRRKLLTGIGVAGLGSLSGCSSARSIVRSGPPHFEEVELSGPESIEVGSEFSIEVSAKNTGGEAGDFTTTLSVGEGAFSVQRGITIEDVPVAQTKSTEVGPISVDYTGEFQFRITDYDTSHTVETTTLETTTESVPKVDGLEYEIGEITTLSSAFYENYDGQGVVRPPSGSVFAVVSLKIRNSADESRDAWVPALNGKGPLSTVADGVSVESLEGVGRRLFEAGNIPAGGSRAGDVLYQLPESEFKGDLEFTWQRGSGGGEPEIRMIDEADDRGVAELGVEEMQNSGPVEIMADAPVTVWATNDGNAEGTFRAIIESELPDGSWETEGTLSVAVPPGETATWNGSVTNPFVETRRFRLRSFDVDTDIEFVPATRSIGSSFTTEFSQTFSVDSITFSDSFTYSGDGYQYTYESRGDTKYALAKVSAKNTGNEDFGAPGGGYFHLSSDGSEYRNVTPFDGIEFDSPVSGDLYLGGSSNLLSPGETLEGWLAFDAPGDATKSDVQIVYDSTKYVGGERLHRIIRWSADGE